MELTSLKLNELGISTSTHAHANIATISRKNKIRMNAFS